MSAYRVTYERDEEGWWIARLHGVAGVHSNGRTIEEARRRVREALSLAVDDADRATLIDDVKLPAEIRRVLRAQQAAKKSADRASRRARDLEWKVAERLTRELKLSRRDAGALLGVSHQTIQKLMSRQPRRRRRAQGGRAVEGRA